MKSSNFLRYVVLPAAAMAAGVRVGIKYAKDHYVVRDRKFIDAEVIEKKK